MGGRKISNQDFFCQQFSYNNTVIVKRDIERLEKGINDKGN